MTVFNAEPAERRIAYFISPHGYGHAARAAAVMTALVELDPAIRFEIFTRVPRWFFQDSLPGSFGYHSLLTDIGLVQATALSEDLPETVRRLNDFLPFDCQPVQRLAQRVHRLNCRLIVCDIAPLGLVVAREAGLPSVLVENFTWDWIYQDYVPYDGQMSRHAAYLQAVFTTADYHVQTEPICDRRAADLTTPPVSRGIRTPARQVRQQLGIPDLASTVLITMGGIPWQYTFLRQLENQRDVYFIVPGAGTRMQRRGRLILLPNRSGFHHPDLINASDAVMGKLGYSTLAEVYQAGVPFGYIPRRRFRESPVLAAYIHSHMHGLAVDEAQFQDGSWLSLLPDLLALPRIQRRDPDGAGQVARFIGKLLKGYASCSLATANSNCRW